MLCMHRYICYRYIIIKSQMLSNSYFDLTNNSKILLVFCFYQHVDDHSIIMADQTVIKKGEFISMITFTKLPNMYKFRNYQEVFKHLIISQRVTETVNVLQG